MGFNSGFKGLALVFELQLWPEISLFFSTIH